MQEFGLTEKGKQVLLFETLLSVGLICFIAVRPPLSPVPFMIAIFAVLFASAETALIVMISTYAIWLAFMVRLAFKEIRRYRYMQKHYVVKYDGETLYVPEYRHPLKIKEISVGAITRIERKRTQIRFIEKGNYATMSKYICNANQLLDIIDAEIHKNSLS